MDCAGLLPVLDALLVVATCPERERDQDDHEHERDLQTEATPSTKIICQQHSFVTDDLDDGDNRCPMCRDMTGLAAQRPPRGRR